MHIFVQFSHYSKPKHLPRSAHFVSPFLYDSPHLIKFLQASSVPITPLRGTGHFAEPRQKSKVQDKPVLQSLSLKSLTLLAQVTTENHINNISNHNREDAINQRYLNQNYFVFLNQENKLEIYVITTSQLDIHIKTMNKEGIRSAGFTKINHSA